MGEFPILNCLPKYTLYLLLIPESDTSISSYLAALYAGNILLILGLTPANI